MGLGDILEHAVRGLDPTIVIAPKQLHAQRRQRWMSTLTTCGVRKGSAYVADKQCIALQGVEVIDGEVVMTDSSMEQVPNAYWARFSLLTNDTRLKS